MCKDDYLYSSPMTVGGLETPGLFSVDCPFSGDRYEYSIASISTFTGTGIVYVSDSDIKTVPEPNAIIGDASTAPTSFLPGFYFAVAPNITLLPSTQFLPLKVGAKRIYVASNVTAYVTIIFRMLPVKIIPARTLTYPDGAEQQANIARSDRAIERLELDIEKGDTSASYGRLQ